MFSELIKAKCKEQEAILQKAKEENRGMNDEELQKINALQSDIDGLEKSIEAAKKLEEQRAKLTDPVNTPIYATPKPKDDGKPFVKFGEQLRAVAMAAGPQPRIDERLNIVNAASGMSEGVPSDGGFLVQQDFVSALLQQTFETGKLPGKCKRVPISTNANSMKINGVDETSRAEGSRHGGIQTFWEGEADQLTGSKPKFRQIDLNLRKLTGLCYATDELLQDAAAIESIITDAFANEFGFKMDDALINGDGVGKPLGILNSGTLVTVAKEAGQAANTITAENIVKMYSRNYAESAAEWYINRDILPQLYTLSLSVGTGGAPIFVPAGGYAGTPLNTLLGRPINMMEQCKTLGTKGDIIFADFGDYYLADKGFMTSATSIHVRFLYDEVAFRFIYRVDGQPKRASALNPANGSNTLSAFVTLATRS